MDENKRASLRAWADKMGDPWSGNDQAADAVLDLLDDHERLRAAAREVWESRDIRQDHRPNVDPAALLRLHEATRD